ncbi:MAG: hypothetical protein Q9157_007752 [Trypethelium eluteriae]
MENSLQKWLVLLAILGSVTRISELENSNKVVKGLLRAIVIQANMYWWNARDGETDEREVPERVFVVGSSTTPETANEAQERVPAEQSKTTEQIQKLRSTIEKLKEECVRLLRANHQLHDQIDEVEASGVDEASRGDEAPRGNGGAHMAHGFGLFPDGRVKVFYPPDPQPSSPEGFVGRFCDLAKEPVPKDSGHSDTEDPRPLSMGEVLDRFFGPGEELVPKDTGRWDTEDPLAQDETADGGVAVNEWRDIDVPASDNDDNEYEILH